MLDFVTKENFDWAVETATKKKKLDCSSAEYPEGKIVNSDVSIAKNYLNEQEMRSLERIVSAYLDLAEDRAERHILMTMTDTC